MGNWERSEGSVRKSTFSRVRWRGIRVGDKFRIIKEGTRSLRFSPREIETDTYSCARRQVYSRRRCSLRRRLTIYPPSSDYLNLRNFEPTSNFPATLRHSYRRPHSDPSSLLIFFVSHLRNFHFLLRHGIGYSSTLHHSRFESFPQSRFLRWLEAHTHSFDLNNES